MEFYLAAFLVTCGSILGGSFMVYETCKIPQRID